ncbi:MAG: CHASE2 domain-containing protein [Thermodesulfobacteriota bacterium]
MHEHGSTGLYVGTALTLVVWTLGLIGAFSVLDGIIYDSLVRWAPHEERSDSQVLLVQMDYPARPGGDDPWLGAISTLEKLGAKQVIFLFFPVDASRGFYETVRSNPRVFFGVESVLQAADSSPPRFGAIPAQARGLGLKTGLLAVPEPVQGVNRLAQAYSVSDGRKLEYLMVRAARERLGSLPRLPQFFLVNFISRPTGLPKVQLSNLLDQKILKEVVRGRSVVLGYRVPNRFNGLHTPRDPARPRMSPLEFHGLALDTLLSRRTIAETGNLAGLCLIALVIFVCLVVNQILSARMAFLVTAMMIVGVFVAGALVLWWGKAWIPPAQLLAALVLALAVASIRRSSLQREAIGEFLLDKSAKAGASLVPESFVQSEDHWNQILHMLNQTLSLEKAIFLEKVEGDHRVREVVALNTSVSAIEERRRDYERTPYSTAVEERGPIRVGRFMRGVDESEEQYLVPLMFGGQVLGFWAFTVKADASANVEALLPLVRSFAIQIAELLHRRKAWRASQKERKSVVRRAMGLESGAEIHQEISQVVALLELRLSLFESSMDSLHSATMICDLFGRVLGMNGRMRELLTSLKVLPFQLTALDVAVRLTGRSPQDLRMAFSRAIIDHHTLTFPVTLTVGNMDSAFLLGISALKGEVSDLLGEEDSGAYPFSMLGLLLEMREVADRADMTRIKDQILERGSTRIEEGVDALLSSVDRLEDLSPSDRGQAAVFSRLRSEKALLSAAMKELQSYLSEDGFSSTVGYFPVNAAEQVGLAASAVAAEAAQRNIDVRIEAPESPPLVLAFPEELVELLETLVRMLIHDAYEDTSVVVNIRSEGLQVVHELSDTGYGMPDEDFQRYLSRPGLTESEDFGTIHRLMPQLAMCRGELTGESQVGQGLRFTLKLVKSLLSS